MSNEKKTVVTPEEDYRVSFMPGVHRIGRSTMAVAMVLSFLPWAYFFFIKGYTLPVATYLSGIAAVASIGIGMWISEPEAYWPVLGSAGTYIGYLSGNVGSLRFPVALTVQRQANADITTPRGQVITVIGIVSSVVVNLVLLLVTVLAGEWILSIMPEVVMSAFGYCLVSMFGSMLLNMVNTGKGGGEMVKNIVSKLPYIVFAVATYFLVNYVFTSLAAAGLAIAVGGAVLISYFLYRHDLKKAEAEEAQ